MEDNKITKKLSTRTIVLLGIGAVILIAAVLYFVSGDVADDNNGALVVVNENISDNANANVVVTENNNAANVNTTVVVEDDANANQAVNSNSNVNENAAVNQQVVTSAVTINDSAIQLVEKQTGYCQALAPESWSFVTNAEATGADLFSPDQSQHAGWGISAVYISMYADVDSFLNDWLGYAYTGSFNNDSITLGTAQEIYDGFIQRDFTTSTGRQGFTIYKTYDFGDPTYYVVSVYIADTAIANWETNGATPFSVALSIRCVSQLRPTTTDVDLTTSDPSSGDDNPELSLSDKWTEAILGYENVYSPSTGEHYEAPITSLWETGPDGSGYYRNLPGGGYEKLERGFGSY